MAASNDNMTKHSHDSEAASDAERALSDVGTIPTSAKREARASTTSSGRPLLKANPALSPGVRAIDPPDGIRSKAGVPGALPPEADGANPLTLAPNDPRRESDEGQPYLDDANPYGRPLINRQNRPMGGIGAAVDPNDEERPHDRTEAPTSEKPIGDRR